MLQRIMREKRFISLNTTKIGQSFSPEKVKIPLGLIFYILPLIPFISKLNARH